MIYFNFNIRIRAWASNFKSYKTWHGILTQNKAWEIQLMKTDCLFRAIVDISTKQDHAGINIELGLFGYEIDATIYDVRHWDSEWSCWK